MDDTEHELTKLHPNHLKMTRVVIALYAVPFVIGAIVLELMRVAFFGVFIVPALLLFAILILRFALRRYTARGYDMSGDRLRVVRGIMFHSDTVVPFGRIQHIDVDQGPLQRVYGLATLTVHTAGTHNSSVQLPGLKHERATEMREEIRRHIKRETL